MTPKNYPVNNYNDYHAHVYFEQETLAFATDLCEKAGERFGLTVGDIIQRPIGPHPKWSCQIMFTANDFVPTEGFPDLPRRLRRSEREGRGGRRPAVAR